MSPMLYRIALGAIAAGFRQGLPDFAFGLIIISIWAWTIRTIARHDASSTSMTI
jgi:uncharacterized protein